MSNRMDYMGPLKNILLATDGSKSSIPSVYVFNESWISHTYS
ncbi:MAG: hypothetical protein WA104_06525 [Thermodesulfovibrionales bacterium]